MRIYLTATLSVLLAAGCSDFATEPDRSPAEFSMTPETVLLTEGETVSFEYTVLDQDGQPYDRLPGWAAPLWTYSADSVLWVDASGRGEAVGPGEVEATAELANLRANAVVRVNPAEMQVGTAFAHITQSVQTRAGAVPIVAGRPGLLRVYLQSDKPNFFQPSVLAAFYRGGSEVHTALLTHGGDGVPQAVEEGDLVQSFDAVIPGTVLQPGTSLVLEIDPDGIIPASTGSTLRVPATGEAPLDIVEVPPFRVRLVPVNQSLAGLPSRFDADIVDARLRLTHDIFPLAELDPDVREPYTTDLDLATQEGWYTLIEDLVTLRLDDGSDRYYYGGFHLPSGSPFGGLGYVGYPVSIGTDASAGTLAHELGHNLSLPHAPCSPPNVEIAGVDPSFPYTGGETGQWGWDPRHGRLYDPDRTYDLMSYCDPAWISDYNYRRVMMYRDTSSFDAVFRTAGGVMASREDVLIVHAGVLNGALRVSPGLETAAQPLLPIRGGRYTLEGMDATGAVLFALSFEPRPLDHGGALFSAAIPSRIAQTDRLATLRVRGPEGTAEQTRRGGPGVTPPGISVATEAGPGGAVAARWDAGAYPLAVVRDRTTGRIVAMGRSGRLELAGGAEALDVTLSDGVRSYPAEQRR
ncbi:MAG: M66 family metalloprotease [Candidatus Longimicrobiales bacterium M2_2A_002]